MLCLQFVTLLTGAVTCRGTIGCTCMSLLRSVKLQHLYPCSCIVSVRVYSAVDDPDWSSAWALNLVDWEYLLQTFLDWVAFSSGLVLGNDVYSWLASRWALVWKLLAPPAPACMSDVTSFPTLEALCPSAAACSSHCHHIDNITLVLLTSLSPCMLTNLFFTSPHNWSGSDCLCLPDVWHLPLLLPCLE